MNLIADIEEFLTKPPRCGEVHLIAIDGHAGAGKTTLANDLYLALCASHTVALIHMDEMYEGWEKGLGKSLSSRLSDLLTDLSHGKPHRLPIYDWNQKAFNSVRVIAPVDILILEGVGSAQRVVREYSSATIWLDIDPVTGLHRVLERDGEGIEPFMIQWQVDENEHYRQEKTRENADFILSTLLSP